MIQIYTIRDCDTVVDINMKVYNNLNNIYTFIELNSDKIVDINTDLTQYIGDILYYDASLLKKETIILNDKNSTTLTTVEKQSIYDLCIQQYGNLDNLYQFLLDNKIDSIDDFNISLTSVIIDNTKIKSNHLREYFEKNNIKIITCSDIVLKKFDYLLLETDGYILLEDNSKIIIKNG